MQIFVQDLFDIYFFLIYVLWYGIYLRYYYYSTMIFLIVNYSDTLIFFIHVG
jgi:hypothetical protein